METKGTLVGLGSRYVLELPFLASELAPATVCAKGSTLEAPPSRSAGWGFGPEDLWDQHSAPEPCFPQVSMIKAHSHHKQGLESRVAQGTPS